MQRGNPQAPGAPVPQGPPEYDPTDEPSFLQWFFAIRLPEMTIVKKSQEIISQRNQYLQKANELAQRFPWTTTFLATALFSAFYLSNNTLCSQAYPQAMIYSKPSSVIHKKIMAGRSIRKELGGRTWTHYVQDCARLGIRVNEAAFRRTHPPFFDEVEFFEFALTRARLAAEDPDAFEAKMYAEQEQLQKLEEEAAAAAEAEQEEEADEDDEYEDGEYDDDDYDDGDYDDDDDDDDE